MRIHSFTLPIAAILFLGLSTISRLFAADLPVLTIYTYQSFVSGWGPKLALQTRFEEHCQCRIEWVAFEDGAAILSRLKLEGTKTKADIVIGLDNNLTTEATATGLFQNHELDLGALQLPVKWSDQEFVPFDYGYFAFIYDRDTISHPPSSLSNLIESKDRDRIIIMDPRTSTPGLGLLLWIKAVYGDKAGMAWSHLAPRILTVTKGWGEGYGLFLKGEVPLVLSYTTSPAFHRMLEGSYRYRAALFPEGHYMQIEVAGRIATTDQPELAHEFLGFLISQEAQEIIPTTNWMYPVIDIGEELPDTFRNLPKPEKTLLLPGEEVAKNRTQWIEEWLTAVTP